MRLAFVVADARAQRPAYTTVYLARAALARGHEVGFVSVDDLTLATDDEVTARTVRAPAAASNEALCEALGAPEATIVDEALARYDVVFLRYNPNREGTFAGNPAIDFGWRLRLGGVLVVNDPEGTQRAGGRMYLSSLPHAIRPRTLITRDPKRAKAFLREIDAPAVLKPLAEKDDDEGSLFYVARGQVKNLNQMMSVLTKRGYMVVQEYLPEASQGEKRMLLLAGEPIRADGKTALYRRPDIDLAAGQVLRADESILGARRRCEFGPDEQKIVDLLRPRLVADGLYLVGVDLVGDKVIEVNVFTPGGMHANLELYGLDVADVVVRDLERRVAVRQAYVKTQGRVA